MLHEGALDGDFDVARFLTRERRVSTYAMECLFGHGQVSINGRTLEAGEHKVSWREAST